jgi:hypothetical protein
MQAINLLGQLVEAEVSNNIKMRGEVYYFNEKVLILKKDK